jgi:hypothetical protein
VPITISGIRVNDVHIEPDAEHGGYRIKTSEYSLIGSTGKVLAKQTLGGYQGMTLEPSPATKAALDAFMKSYVGDVQSLLGLLEG